jgi:hypothetical protein
MSREQELDWLGWNLVSRNHIWRPRVGTTPQLRARKPGRDTDCPEGDLEPVPRSSKARSQSFFRWLACWRWWCLLLPSLRPPPITRNTNNRDPNHQTLPAGSSSDQFFLPCSGTRRSGVGFGRDDILWFH